MLVYGNEAQTMKIKDYFENGYHNVSQKSKYVTCHSLNTEFCILFNAVALNLYIKAILYTYDY
jgi:hypothetical protein